MHYCRNFRYIYLQFFHKSTYGGPILYPCSSWNEYATRKEDKQYLTPFSLLNFENELQTRREDLFTNYKTYCANCQYYKSEDDSVKTPDLPYPYLKLCVSFKCSLNCPYCYYQKEMKRNDELNDSFIENLARFEKYVLSSTKIKALVHTGMGEFFENPTMMKLYKKWKEKYNLKLAVITNMLHYDPEYPLDYLLVSWHKNADKAKMIENINKIPTTFENMGEDIEMNMLVNDKYGFTLDEAYELATKYIDPSRFFINYRPIETNGLLEDMPVYTQQEIDAIIAKTDNFGFKKTCSHNN